MRIFLLTLFLCLGFSAQSEQAWRKYTSAKFLTEEDGVAPGQKLTVGFEVHLEKGWHAYWVNPGDSGAPVKLSLNGKVGSKTLDLLTGPIQFPIAERMETGPITSFVYNKEVLFLADIVVPESLHEGDRLDLHLDAEWLVCDEVCIPAIDSYNLSLPVKAAADVKPSDAAEEFVSWRGRHPRLMTAGLAEKRDDKKAELTIQVPIDFAKYKYHDFLPLRGSHLANDKPNLISKSPREIHLSLPLRPNGDRRSDLVGLLILENGEKKIGLQWGDPSYGFIIKAKLNRAELENKTMDEAGSQLLWILFSAFVGGLILNLMPCVFPILSIKLLSVVKQSGAELSKVRAQNFAYTAGVLASFLLIGVLLSALRSAGQFVGWGFQLQSPYFVLLICWMFFILALQLFGVYEFTWIDGNVGGKLARQGGNAGAFFTGVLAVVVASPCTAPFMGAALGFAVSQPPDVLIAIFLMMGLGLASPYLLFGIFPSWSRALPRPGPWMQTFKIIMGVPLILTCIWLLWLLNNLKGFPGLTLALIGLALWFLIFWFKSKRKVTPIMLSGLLILIGVMTLYRLPDAPMKSPELHSELIWEPFQEGAVGWNGESPLFIDFTADWCLTCKVNEKLVFNRKDVIALFRNNRVRLMKGDWTRQDEAITRFLGKYQRIGVPFYIVFGPGAPDGKILPEVLTPESFKRAMQSVLQIKEGLK